MSHFTSLLNRKRMKNLLLVLSISIPLSLLFLILITDDLFSKLIIKSVLAVMSQLLLLFGISGLFNGLIFTMLDYKSKSPNNENSWSRVTIMLSVGALMFSIPINLAFKLYSGLIDSPEDVAQLDLLLLGEYTIALSIVMVILLTVFLRVAFEKTKFFKKKL